MYMRSKSAVKSTVYITSVSFSDAFRRNVEAPVKRVTLFKWHEKKRHHTSQCALIVEESCPSGHVPHLDLRRDGFTLRSESYLLLLENPPCLCDLVLICLNLRHLLVQLL